MRCPHCNNTMVYEKFFGPGEPFWGWRCIHCGEIIDDMVLENRATQVGAHGILRKKQQLGEKNGPRNGFLHSRFN